MVTDVLLDSLCVQGGLKFKPVTSSHVKLCFPLAGLPRRFNVYIEEGGGVGCRGCSEWHLEWALFSQPARFASGTHLAGMVTLTYGLH